MRAYHWVVALAAGVVLTASAAAAILSSQKSVESENVQIAAVKNESSRSLIRESQNRPPAAPANPAPQRVVTTNYGAWVVVCREPVSGGAKSTCVATLRASETINNRRIQILEWQIGLNKEGHFVTAFHVPPGARAKKDDKAVLGPLLIQKGLEVKFGSGPARRISYLWCGPKQCLAEALIDDAFVKDALANTKATITVYISSGESAPIEVPINGIDKAISATRK